METNIINVGNSKGIIIPSKLLKFFGITNVVDVEIEGESLVIRPSKKARVGWEEMIKKEVEKNGKSKLLIPEFFEDEPENDDWTW